MVRTLHGIRWAERFESERGKAGSVMKIAHFVNVFLFAALASALLEL